jgi:hypothetical protein
LETFAVTELKPGWLKKDLNRARVWTCKRELVEAEQTIRDADRVIDQIKHNRELAVMRCDMLRKEIAEKSE